MDVSMLGLGSNNQLNSNTINALKEADVAIQINPLTRRIEETDVKIDKLSSILSTFSDFTESIRILSTPEYYDYLNVEGNDSVDIKIKEGALPADFSMNVTQIARPDVFQSNTFATDSQTTTSDQHLKLKVGYNPEVDLFIPAGTTYGAIKDYISALPDVDAKIIKVSDLEFRMTLFSESTGAESAITITSEDPELNSIFGFSNPANHVQVAQDANFSYNGVVMSRSTNTFSDLATGVEFTLRRIGDNNISLSPDAEALTSSVQTFVDQYNTLAKTITEQSLDENDENLFKTHREIREVFKRINSQLFETNINMSLQKESLTSAVSIGIQKNRDGTLSINPVANKSLLEIAQTDFFKIKELFTNVNAEEPTKNGVFVQLREETDAISNKTKTGSLNILLKSFEDSKVRTQTQIDKTQAKIDKQYEIMKQKFATFDSLINQMTNSFSSLKLQIDQSVSTKDN